MDRWSRDHHHAPVALLPVGRLRGFEDVERVVDGGVVVGVAVVEGLGDLLEQHHYLAGALSQPVNAVVVGIESLLELALHPVPQLHRVADALRVCHREFEEDPLRVFGLLLGRQCWV